MSNQPRYYDYDEGTIHKVRQHVLIGEGEGSEIKEKVKTYRYKKVLTWGKGGGSKIAKKVLTYFMDGPKTGPQNELETK